MAIGNVGDTVVVSHSPGPDGAHEIVETNDREMILDNGAMVFDHEFGGSHLSLERTSSRD